MRQECILDFTGVDVVSAADDHVQLGPSENKNPSASELTDVTGFRCAEVSGVADGERVTISPVLPGALVSLAVEQPDLDVDGRLTTGQQASSV
ncbi:unnamed protein product, partial [Mesorhabditis spiculigera]